MDNKVLSERILDVLDYGLSRLGFFFLCSITIVTMLAVFSRYVLNMSVPWTSEIAQWLFIYLIFCGIPIAHRNRTHISLNLIEKVLPLSLKQGHRLLIDALVSYVTISLIFGGWDVVRMVGGIAASMPLPGWLQYVCIPVFSAIALIYIALRDAGVVSNARWCGTLSVIAGAILYVIFDIAGLHILPEGYPVATLAISFMVALLLGVPVAFAMLLSVFFTNMSAAILPTAAIVQNVVRGSGQFLILAIPLFLLAGGLMNVGGLTQRLIDFSYSLVGHWRGGLGQVTVLSATLYGGMSGSSNADCALSAKMLYPAMLKDGYQPGFSAATCAASAILPNVIPPSIAMLIMAAATNISVGQMFMAGITVGSLIAFFMMITVYLVARSNKYGASISKVSWNDRARSGFVAMPALFLAALIIFTLRFGIATPTEVGAIAVLYSLIVGMILRSFTWKALWEVIYPIAVDASLIGLLIGAALPFSFVLTTERVPELILNVTMAWFKQDWLVLIFMNLILLVAGMFMDIGAAILIFAPLFYPLALHVGINDVHFAMIVVCNLMLGGVTPPVGMLTYIAATVTKIDVIKVFKEMLPFFIALLTALGFITFVPAVSLVLLWLTGD